MSTKAQHAKNYLKLPKYLRKMREEATLTQRELGELLRKPHSWIYNCETGNRRVDVTEFAAWTTACSRDPGTELNRFLKGG